VSVENFETFNTKDAVIWIDPLDGTNDFVKGNFSAVTVLIGLSINGFSRAGIVHNPFHVDDLTKGQTFFGSAEHGVFQLPHTRDMTTQDLVSRELNYLKPFDMLGEPAEDHRIKVAASLTHFSEQMSNIIKTLEPVEICRIGGAGNKCNNIAIGNVDCYIHPSPGLCYWDLCAPESLIKGMGGYATNLA